MQIRRVGILGGAGFLGSHVSDLLQTKGYQVDIFDSSELHAEQSVPHKFWHGTMEDTDILQEFFAGKEAIFHFAGIANIEDANLDPTMTMYTNFINTCRILQYALDAGVTRFFYASSMYCSGDSGGFYRVSKSCSEAYINEFSKQYPIDCQILRIGSVFGPRSGPDNTIFKVLSAALGKRDEQVVYSSKTKRKYLFVLDVARVCVELLQRPPSNVKLFSLEGQAFYSIQEVDETVCDILGVVDEDRKLMARPRFAENNPLHFQQSPYSWSDETPVSVCPELVTSFDAGIVATLKYLAKERCSKSADDA